MTFLLSSWGDFNRFSIAYIIDVNLRLGRCFQE